MAGWLASKGDGWWAADLSLEVEGVRGVEAGKAVVQEDVGVQQHAHLTAELAVGVGERLGEGGAVAHRHGHQLGRELRGHCAGTTATHVSAGCCLLKSGRVGLTQSAEVDRAMVACLEQQVDGVHVGVGGVEGQAQLQLAGTARVLRLIEAHQQVHALQRRGRRTRHCVERRDRHREGHSE